MNRRALFMSMAAGLIAAPVQGQRFPQSRVEVVVPFPAGGASDAIVRAVQAEYQLLLEQPVAVEYVVGEGGHSAVQRVLGSAADGHVQIAGSPDELILMPLVNPDGWHRPEDFRLVGLVATSDICLVLRSDAAPNTVAELLQWASGRTLRYARIGYGSISHIAGDQFARTTGMSVEFVDFEAVLPAVEALVDQEVDIAFVPLSGPATRMFRQGKLKPLGIASDRPNPTFPALPLLNRHKAFADFQFDVWVGVEVPRSTPDAVVTHLNMILSELLTWDTVRAKMFTSGARPPDELMSVAQLDRFYARELQRYRAFSRAARIPPLAPKSFAAVPAAREASPA